MPQSTLLLLALVLAFLTPLTLALPTACKRTSLVRTTACICREHTLPTDTATAPTKNAAQITQACLAAFGSDLSSFSAECARYSRATLTTRAVARRLAVLTDKCGENLPNTVVAAVQALQGAMWGSGIIRTGVKKPTPSNYVRPAVVFRDGQEGNDKELRTKRLMMYNSIREKDVKE